ncbi:helicase C-terminal domain-containing protein [Alkalibacillus almallahensis]|uniref:helicase C-terminal domain-containing protein n=1 Tax=Alkalibacillus almallahensis TaxID=1379154 RepID=UPI001420088C|nr:ATP-dependent DNA helicase DinG [Alkalibacillus almallahensis]
MVERYIIVDLETTGHAVSKGAEIIEIGIVIFEGKEIVDEFKSKVKPKDNVPSFISHLTGITNEDLVDAPTFENLAPKLHKMLQNGYFVAHHVPFDFAFLNESFEQVGMEPLTCHTIDTVELARLCFPKAPSYKLSEIVDYLGIEHYSPHRALSDAYVTGQLWLNIREKLETLPYQTLQQLKPFIPSLHSQIESWFDNLLEERRYNYKSKSFNDYSIYNQEQEKKIINSNFNDWLEAKERTLSYELRDQQREMAKTIYSHVHEASHLVAEAGSGLGKTRSYLLPSIYNGLSGYKTLISTSTIQLQQQIVHEANLMNQQLGSPLKTVLLKSPRHYIHIKRFQTYLDHFEDYSNYDAVLTASMLIVWLTETQTGDVDELNLPTNGQQIWHYINCENPHTSKEGSYFHDALRNCEQAELIIVNHAFLIRDAIQNQQIPEHDSIIIDEAHQLENTTRHQLARQLNYVHIVHLLQDLQPILPFDLIEQARQSADTFFRAIYLAVDFLHEDDMLTDTGKAQLILDESNEMLLTEGDIKEQFHHLSAILGQIIDFTNQHALQKDWYQLLIHEAIQQITRFKQTLKQFFESAESHIKWVETNQYGAKNAATLHIEPVSVSETLQSLLFNKQPVVLTSSTLQINHDFKPFLVQTGLSEQTACVEFSAPFDYQEQVRVLTPNHLPDVTKTDLTTYTSGVSDFIIQYMDTIQQKMLILFTSFDMLRLVYKQLKRSKTLEHVTVIGQGVTTGSREKLKKMFETTDHIILLGTHSFWEGFDVNDQSCKTVCMVRLPFETPSSPIMQAKQKSLSDQNTNTFYQLALPIAVQRFRQAFGRMIRNEQDRGVFLVLDQRIYTKRYGQTFLNGLPHVESIHATPEQVINDAKIWLT